MNNAPYHRKQVDKTPSKYDVKADMTAWMERKGVAASSSMRKSILGFGNLNFLMQPHGRIKLTFKCFKVQKSVK
jgi:hypothetical protein